MTDISKGVDMHAEVKPRCEARNVCLSAERKIQAVLHPGETPLLDFCGEA